MREAGRIIAMPTVSIGMPVYNGERHLKNAIDALLSQSFVDFELIISDNASSDKTEAICRQYAASDSRIRYIRQRENQGAFANFKFVLDEARSEYFMWAACDDTRSPDFLEVNLKFLSENPEYVASTSPNGYEGQSMEKHNLVYFSLDGDVFSRFEKFFRYCWISNGIFYSLIRTRILLSCEIVGQSFIAADWAINLYLASRGKIHRTTDGYTILGIKGASNDAGAFKAFRNSLIEFPLPFYRLTLYVIMLTRNFPVGRRMKMIHTLAKLNLTTVLDQLLAFFKVSLR